MNDICYLYGFMLVYIWNGKGKECKDQVWHDETWISNRDVTYRQFQTSFWKRLHQWTYKFQWFQLFHQGRPRIFKVSLPNAWRSVSWLLTKVFGINFPVFSWKAPSFGLTFMAGRPAPCLCWFFPLIIDLINPHKNLYFWRGFPKLGDG